MLRRNMIDAFVVTAAMLLATSVTRAHNGEKYPDLKGSLMPTRKNQPPPDLRNFSQ